MTLTASSEADFTAPPRPDGPRPAMSGDIGPEARHFRAIVEALARLGQASAEELGDHTGLGMVAVARRLPELEKLGHVAPVGRLRQNRSGRADRVWTLTGA